jgi:hypothetical protein
MPIRLSDFLITNQTSNQKLFTAKSLSKHNTPEDCLIAINGKVYDITKYSNDLIKNNKKKSLGITCGNIFNGIPSQIFNTDNYNNYEIGEIQFYFLKKIIYLVSLFFVYLFFFYFGFILKNNISPLFKMASRVIIYITTIYIISKVLFKKNFIKFNNDYVEEAINPPEFQTVIKNTKPIIYNDDNTYFKNITNSPELVQN